MKYNNRYADKKLKEGVELEIEGGTVKDYAGEGDNIVIPEGITEIADSAFMSGEFKTVSLPESLKKIGGWAFHDCKNLKEIKIPDDVTQIGE